MSTRITTGSDDGNTDAARAWHIRASELAKWARRYFVRRDRYGGYYLKAGETKTCNKPAQGPEEEIVTLDLLERHFRATATDDVIGAHALVPGGGGGWAAVDIDAHEGTGADAGANERFARAIHEELTELGLCPLTYESNGKGGYHVVVFFNVLVPGQVLYAFARWLLRRYAEFGFDLPSEAFPKQSSVPEGGYGNWFRVIGRHHTRNFWPRVWDGDRWLSGDDAVSHVLSVTRGDPDLIPFETLVAGATEAPEPPRPAETEDGRPGDDFNRRGGESATRELLQRHGWTLARERGGGVSEWTRPGKATGCSGTLGFCKADDGVPKFFCWSNNASPLEAGRAYTPFALCASLEHAGDYRATALGLHAKGYGANLAAVVESEKSVSEHPVITISTDEFRVNTEAATALGTEPDLYQRGGLLTQVLEAPAESEQPTAVRRSAGAPILRELSPALLRERLTRCARFVLVTDEGLRLAHPPAWCVQAVRAHGKWPAVRRLEALVTHPTLLPDGNILSVNGYDPGSNLLVCTPTTLGVTVPDRPTSDDVSSAVAQLLDVVIDFPFARTEHLAAWVASLLTPFAWFAFEGPAPWFLIDKNVRGAGAGLLADTVALTVTGRRFAVMSYTHEREELRKRITTLAVEGERLVLLDNLAGAVGNDVLDAALTADRWRDRLLGGNRVFDAQLHICWFGTGNNVQLHADTARRVCHIRMETADERPELRTGFKYPDLRKHVRANRGRLLSAALTILRGWIVAGRPLHDLKPWGSFEGWSGVVREAIVFAGLPDPGETRVALQTTADRDAGAMTALLSALEEMDPNGLGVTVAEIIDRVKAASGLSGWVADLRSAVEELCGRLDARTLGYRFRQFQRRNFEGRMLDKARGTHGTNRWVVLPADGISVR